MDGTIRMDSVDTILNRDRNDHLIDPWTPFEGHEQVVIGEDASTGLRAVVAIHSTALGPALGGTRMRSYSELSKPSWGAYMDALRLSRAMSFKNALAGLPHGGGKGVILGDPKEKSPALLRAYGRLVASLGGRYVTAGDVGIGVSDMDTIAKECAWTTGRSPTQGGLGDSGILTAFGIWQAMRASAKYLWQESGLEGRRVGILGAGKVGYRLAQHLNSDGADVVIYDVDERAVKAMLDIFPEFTVAESEQALLSAEIDILSPNALGGVVSEDLAHSLKARMICGGANNQLSSPSVATTLKSRDILYVPDFMVNCGGVIQVAAEYAGESFDTAKAKVMKVFETTTNVLSRAQREGITPLAAAEIEAEKILIGRR